MRREVKITAADLERALTRQIPRNEDAERAVVAAVITDERALDAVRPILPSGEMFFGDALGRIFDAAVELRTNGVAVDPVTLWNHLQDRERGQAIGGVTFIVKLVDATPSVANVAAHAKIVREKWRVRQAIEAMQVQAHAGCGDYGDAQGYLDDCVAKLTKIAQAGANRKDASLLYDVMLSVVSKLDGTTPSSGLATGFTAVDEMTTGMHDGELIIVAARPGMGKTAYVLGIARNVADGKQGGIERGAMVFSLEMPAGQLGQRLVSMDAGVDIKQIRKGALSPAEHDRIIGAANHLSRLPVWIDDTPAITLDELRAKVIAKQHEFDRADDEGKPLRKLSLVVVDYLQLMRGKGDNREQEIASITRGLKALAKELGVPIIALSQLNRAVETRGEKNKRPQLSDLRESGSIEQDADCVQFLYRPFYYLSHEDQQSEKGRQIRDYAEVIIAKQRNGPTDTAKVRFVDHCARFENRDADGWRDAA